MNPADAGLAAAGAAAERLLGRAVDSIAPVSGTGRNSKIFVASLGKRRFALKKYPSRADDPRDRLETELRALQLMTRQGIRSVPQPIAGDAERGYALLEWIEGEPVTVPALADIDAAMQFLSAVHELREFDGALLQPFASEACLSGAEVVAQIERRLSRLDAVAANEPMLHALIENDLRPLLATMTAAAKTGYAEEKMKFAAAIDKAARTLCPSDFGFHNALRTPDRGLCFLDFDYFGWDDPVKLVADFLLHPGMNLSPELKQRFFAGVSDLYGSDTKFGIRLRLLYPLFGLRWCVILLNEFLPERWLGRVQAGMQLEWATVKQRQLSQVREFLKILENKSFPFSEENF